MCRLLCLCCPKMSKAIGHGSASAWPHKTMSDDTIHVVDASEGAETRYVRAYMGCTSTMQFYGRRTGSHAEVGGHAADQLVAISITPANMWGYTSGDVQGIPRLVGKRLFAFCPSSEAQARGRHCSATALGEQLCPRALSLWGSQFQLIDRLI